MSTSRKESRRKRPGCLVISILGGIAGFAFLMLVFPNCDANSKQGRMARSLSRDQLAGLHRAMTKLWDKIPKEERESAHIRFGSDQIPEEFGGLDAHLVRIRDGNSIIRLQGCMDHYLDLVFYGVGEPTSRGDHSPRIVLMSGEHEIQTETLWRPDQEAPVPESGK
ncbi:hypothetical protein [Luteolibacter soli]|uniref:Uncharacterized protein n=1 Tax=Luteolibacter soli TaxID=3135280 RepID=A0ABU9AU44_9BACT